MGIFKSKEEKELEKKIQEEDEAIEKEIEEAYEKKYGNEEKQNQILDLIDLIFDDPEDDEKELEKYMTESEKEELKEYKKDNIKLMFSVASIFVVILVFTITGALVFNSAVRSDIEKITIPKMEKYYADTYGSEASIEDAYEYCYKERQEDGKTKEVCTGEVIGTLENGKHIITIDNENIGDDISYDKKLKEYRNNLLEYFKSIDIIETNSFLSYVDYYDSYNMHLDYINVLPADLDLNGLFESGSLTVRDEILYQGDLDINLVKNYISSFSDDSMMYFIKQNRNGLPINLTIASRKGYNSFDITSSINVAKGITYYELDRNKNSITKLKVKEIKNVDVELLDDEREVSKAYQITMTLKRRQKDDPILPNYYFISFEKELLSENNLVFLDRKKEVPLDKYQNVIMYKSGGKMYLIHDANVSFANTREKKSWFCRTLGIC